MILHNLKIAIRQSSLWKIVCITLLDFIFAILVPHQMMGQSINRVKGLAETSHFSTEDYLGGIQNYAFDQDHTGIIYVANNLGMLVYDGEFWTKCGVANGTKVRAVKVTLDGRIYLGAQNEFGYCTSDHRGEYQYHSLSHLLPEGARDVDEVWDIFESKEGVLFAASETIWLYKDGQLKEVIREPNLIWSFLIDDKILCALDNGMLKVYSGDNWSSTDTINFFSGKRIEAVLPLSSGGMLVATYKNGLYTMTGKTVTPYYTHANQVLEERRISKVVMLHDGKLAVGTEDNGLYIIDQHGNLDAHYTKGKGIEDRTIHGIFEDRHHNIWLGLNNGIGFISSTKSHTLLGESLGLPGSGYAALYDAGKLYLGTSNGLYTPRTSLISDQTDIMQLIPDITGQVYTIDKIGDDILVGGHNGSFYLESDNAIQLSDQIGWWQFLPTPDQQYVIAGTYRGLVLLQKHQSQWEIVAKLKGFDESSRLMTFDAKGDLWIAHGYKGAYRIKLSKDWKTIKQVDRYGEKHGLPGGQLVDLYKINNEVVFTAVNGIHVFDQRNESFVPHPMLSKYFDNQTNIRALEEDSFGNIYFITSKNTGVLDKVGNGLYEKVTTPFSEMHGMINDDLVNIHAISPTTTLFGAKNGFTLFDHTVPISHQKFEVSIRSISLIKQNGKIISTGNSSEALFIPFDDNALAFRFAAQHYCTTNTLYRLKLIGLDANWSKWALKSEKEYTNLREGNYTLYIEAKDALGNTSSSKPFTFTVLPPWYRSNIMKAVYVTLAVCFVILILLYIKKKMEIQRRTLVVHQKRALIQKENKIKAVTTQSKAEIDHLRREKLESEVEHKNQELALSTMNLISKNEFINQIKTKIRNIARKESDDQLSKELKRIIKEIDRNLNQDDDWQQFSFHFDQVHDGFLQKIKLEHPDLTPQDIKLCAYLRLSMTTKEIANLLNISVRGVEVSRYRLRKKLNLETKINLSEYMMNYH